MMNDPPEIHEYFEYDKKSYKIAKAAASKLPTDVKVLDYLLEARPRFLHVGDSMMGMDKQQLEKQFHGVADKLTIHCYPDRGDRLRYLHDMLAKKLVENEDFLKLIMKFLLEMSERPTSLLRLEVGDAKYSGLQDADITDEENSISEKELLKQILGDMSGVDDNITVSYSSDSELSDWSSDEEGEQSKGSPDVIFKPPISNVKSSQSFSDFSAIQVLTDHESKQKEMIEYWDSEVIKAKKFWNSEESSSLKPLSCQPVIPGLLALHSKFGEYWEWKYAANHQSQRLMILEEVLIREILWQFSILSPESSQVFSSDWSLKPGLMTSCLSCKSLSSFMLPVQNTLRSLSTFKIFVQQVYQVSNTSFAPIILSYAHGLSDTLNLISEAVQKLERNIKASKNERTVECCTTLIQLMNQIRPYIDCIETLHGVHTSNFQPLNELSDPSTEKDAIACLNLLYSLFTTLNVQRHPMKFGFLMYLFSKCLGAFLEEISSSLTLNWTEHLLFNRFPEINISDHNFWTESIKRRVFDGISSRDSIFSISFFNKLIEEVMIVLKTSEMIRQLDEDCVKIIGHPPNAAEIVDDFLKMICPSVEEEFPAEVPETDLEPDYEKHFRFLGLQNSLEADSVKLILEELSKGARKLSAPSNSTFYNHKWLFNLSINQMPKVSSWYALETTLNSSYNPISSKANHCIHKIFEDYSVDQSLQLFREIILETREDFARSIISLVSTDLKSKPSNYKWEAQSCLNPTFQKLLSDCYPEGRENFDIELKLDRSFDTNYTLVVKPHFPLNLILFEDSIEGYLFVARQLSRIRKSLWEINALSIKDIKTIEGVEPNRMLLFRFAFLHFCSSLRAYLVFKVFGKDVNFCTISPNNDVDLIRRVHGGHLKTIEIELLRNPVIEKVILRKMGKMSGLLRGLWHSGIQSRTMVLLEDTLKKCWSTVLSFRRNSNEYNELAYHFGPIPIHL